CDGARTYANTPDGGHAIRLNEYIIPFADDLWLMEGLFARDKGEEWDRIREFLAGVRRDIQDLVGRDPSVPRLSNAAKPEWEGTIESIRRRRAALGGMSGRAWSFP